MRIDGAIFDLDGTLIDSMPIWDDLSYNLLKSNGIEPKADLRDRVATMYLDESSKYVIDEYHLDMTVEQVSSYINEQVRDFYLYTVPPKADAVDFLSALKRAGVKMCVATATERKLAQPALERNNMFDYFDKIFTCKETGCSKQSPLIFERALEFLGTAKENTVIFEDSLHAVETAKAARFTVAGIFDRASAQNEKAIREKCDIYFSRYSELSAFFDNINTI